MQLQAASEPGVIDERELGVDFNRFRDDYLDRFPRITDLSGDELKREEANWRALRQRMREELLEGTRERWEGILETEVGRGRGDGANAESARRALAELDSFERTSGSERLSYGDGGVLLWVRETDLTRRLVEVQARVRHGDVVIDADLTAQGVFSTGAVQEGSAASVRPSVYTKNVSPGASCARRLE